MNLLTIGNPKTQKGLKRGYLTAVLHLAPSDLSGYNVCPLALRRLAGEAPDGIKSACSMACLNLAGRGGIMRQGETTNAIQQARIRRTRRLYEQREAFMSDLFADIGALIRLADKLGVKPCVRLNGTSDLDWATIRDANGMNAFEAFPLVQFYDYTKVHKRAEAFLAGKLPANYHLTLSVHEHNRAAANDYHARGGNVAAVIAADAMPAFAAMPAYTDGDDTDLRFLDVKGALVALTPKGPARRDNSGFVIR